MPARSREPPPSMARPGVSTPGRRCRVATRSRSSTPSVCSWPGVVVAAKVGGIEVFDRARPKTWRLANCQGTRPDLGARRYRPGPHRSGPSRGWSRSSRSSNRSGAACAAHSPCGRRTRPPSAVSNNWPTSPASNPWDRSTPPPHQLRRPRQQGGRPGPDPVVAACPSPNELNRPGSDGGSGVWVSSPGWGGRVVSVER